jgi:hypothetical protein
MMAKKTIAIGVLAMLAVFARGGSAEAAEGGSSHYLPGVIGEVLFAVPPQPGFLVANTVWFQSGDLGKAVLEGQVDFGLDVDVVLDLVAAAYTFDTPVLGGTYTIAALIPFGYVNIDAQATGPLGGSAGFSEDSFNLSDIAFIPLQLNWSVDKFHFRFSQTIIAPTGGYDLDQAANLGRNYWSFDTAGAVTWFNTGSGTEISVAPGIMLNTENHKTNYKTGSEFHVDFAINQFLSETFAIGVRGYYYKQVSGDSGSGAILGSFKSESVGLGPGFFWTPEFAGGRLVVQGKWMHDFDATNRFESDYGTLGVAWKF